MVWKSLGFSDLWVAGSPVFVRSLLLSDSIGQFRRYRIFSDGGLPAWARLAKDGSGKIGAFITGAYSSFVKVGSVKKIQPCLFVPLSCLSKKAFRKLLIPLDFELCEEENMVVAREIENQPYYVANRNSRIFHHPGCRRAKRIASQNQITFKTRKEALTSTLLSSESSFDSASWERRYEILSQVLQLSLWFDRKLRRRLSTEGQK